MQLSVTTDVISFQMYNKWCKRNIDVFVMQEWKQKQQKTSRRRQRTRANTQEPVCMHALMLQMYIYTWTHKCIHTHTHKTHKFAHTSTKTHTDTYRWHPTHGDRSWQVDFKLPVHWIANCFTAQQFVIYEQCTIMYHQFTSVQSLDQLSHHGYMRDNSAEICFQSILQEALVSSYGIGRDAHSSMLSIQHFLCWLWHCPLSKVPWSMVLERLLWCVACLNHASFCFLTAARRGGWFFCCSSSSSFRSCSSSSTP